MRFVVIFEEGPEMIPVREAHEPAHLAFLEANRAEIPMAGGLRNDHGGPYVGGLWVFEVKSREPPCVRIVVASIDQPRGRR